jgi:hypothetical protein
MSAALSGLAGHRRAVPELQGENPSKIVSGFGGTLCLVISFVYNTAIVCCLQYRCVPSDRRPFHLPWCSRPPLRCS